MSYDKGNARNIMQKGYTAARRGASADIVGWCKPKGEGGRHGSKDGAGAPGQGPVALFGLDDEFVATFDRHIMTVVRFSTIGQEDDAAWLTQVELEFEAIKARPAGHGTPLLIYALDTRGRLWSLDFHPQQKQPSAGGIAIRPLCKRMAEQLEEPIHDIVVFRRQLILQQTRHRGGYDLHALDRRTGQVSTIGSLKLDPDIDALDHRSQMSWNSIIMAQL